MTDGEKTAEAIRNATAAMSGFTEGMQKCMVSVSEAAAALGRLAMAGISVKELLQKASTKETNNWRKMHGLPMRRKGGKRCGSNRNL